MRLMTAMFKACPHYDNRKRRFLFVNRTQAPYLHGRRDMIKMAALQGSNTSSFIQDELESLNRILTSKVEGSQLICCHAAGVQVKIT